jgi:D-threo-aldose 1-dehydrogenase
VAGHHGVDLVAAALQFSLAPDVASALIVGTANPSHILADHAALRTKIASGFWEELQSEGILHAQAAVPENRD